MVNDLIICFCLIGERDFSIIEFEECVDDSKYLRKWNTTYS